MPLFGRILGFVENSGPFHEFQNSFTVATKTAEFGRYGRELCSHSADLRAHNASGVRPST